MTNADTLQNVAQKQWYARIDKETLAELTVLLDRVANTLGTIAPVMELAKNKSATEKKRHLRAVVDLAFRGHHALKAFSLQWALVLEENQKHFLPPSMEDFAEVFEEAKEITIPDPPPNSASIIEVAGTDPPPNSVSVIARAPRALG